MLAIEALGNGNLAVKLAELFPGSGATEALTTLANTASPEVAKSASRALADLFTYLKARVVGIDFNGRRIVSGFAVSETLVVTVSHAVANKSELAVRTSGGLTAPAQIVALDDANNLALLATQSDAPLPHIAVRELPVEYNLPVIALFEGEDGSFETALGSIISTDGDFRVVTSDGKDRFLLGVFLVRILHLTNRFDGTPVVDEAGDLVGVVTAEGEMGDKTLVIPAAKILAFISAYGGSFSK